MAASGWNENAKLIYNQLEKLEKAADQARNELMQLRVDINVVSVRLGLYAAAAGGLVSLIVSISLAIF